MVDQLSRRKSSSRALAAVTDATENRRGRAPVMRISCLRCQRRKIRCDRAFPRCNHCTKVGAECCDGESSKIRNLPRAYIKSLRDRISWLESIVESSCPDVDLAHDGPEIEPQPVGLDEDDGSGGGGGGPETTTATTSSHQHEGPAESEDIVMRNDGSSTSPSSTNFDFNSHPRVSVISSPPSRNGGGVATEGGGEEATPGGASASSSATSMGTGLSHEVGLVSVGANQDRKYIGPSSGFLLSKLMIVSANRAATQSKNSLMSDPDSSRAAMDERSRLVNDLLVTPERPVPITREHTVKLSQIYFDIIHPMYPFLHKPTFLSSIDDAVNNNKKEESSSFSSSRNDGNKRNPMASFHVYMVLAISATIASRLHKIPLSGEGYYMSAMHYFNETQEAEGSIQGLQCLLLLVIFAMHNPSVKLNTWYLNYHCIATVLDLGLQRDIRTDTNDDSNGNSVGGIYSHLEQEMRRRIFWVVMTLDRTIATIMGRPIGIRDEACDLRFPQELSDDDLLLSSSERGPPPSLTTPRSSCPPQEQQQQQKQKHQKKKKPVVNHLSYAIHHFKLTRINTEIKYVANSIDREAPKYAYPNIIDIALWQKTTLDELDQWAAELSSFSSSPSCSSVSTNPTNISPSAFTPASSSSSTTSPTSPPHHPSSSSSPQHPPNNNSRTREQNAPSCSTSSTSNPTPSRPSQTTSYIETVLLIRYHAVRMLLLRPSPAIPNPSPQMLRKCYASAGESIRLYGLLYRTNRLVHDWLSFHSLVLSTITMYYCILSVPDLAATAAAAAASASGSRLGGGGGGGGGRDFFASSIRTSLSILSAIGEHWVGAKRSRDILEELSDPILRWLMKRTTHNNNNNATNPTPAQQLQLGPAAAAEGMTTTAASTTTTDANNNSTPFNNNNNFDQQQQQRQEQFGGSSGISTHPNNIFPNQQNNTSAFPPWANTNTTTTSAEAVVGGTGGCATSWHASLATFDDLMFAAAGGGGGSDGVGGGGYFGNNSGPGGWGGGGGGGGSSSDGVSSSLLPQIWPYSSSSHSLTEQYGETDYPDVDAIMLSLLNDFQQPGGGGFVPG